MSTYFCILTSLGAAKMANAAALGEVVEFSQMALGDGGGSLPTPDQSQTALVNEVRRADLNSVEVDPDNPTWIVCEQVIPADKGGWTIRETGIYDSDGDLIAVGNFPETYKPVLEEGSGRTQTIRMVIQVSNAATVTLKIDPSVVLATREYVDESADEHLVEAKEYADQKDTDHAEAEDPHTQYQTKVLAASQAASEKVYVDGLQNKKRLFTVSGDADNIVLTSKAGETPITALNDFDEFSFIVAATNTSPIVTIKVDELDAVTLSGISSDTQVFETALLTVRYLGGEFNIAEQINPKLGSNVLDIGKLYTDTVDILRPGEYALDGSSLSRSDHPIAFAIVSASSNYIDQATKDADPITYGGYYGDGDGGNTFTLPMVGGEFIRMFDDVRGVDDEREFGAWQVDEFESHAHTVGGTGIANNAPSSYGTSDIGSAADHTSHQAGGDETRPRNIAYYGKTRL